MQEGTQSWNRSTSLRARPIRRANFSFSPCLSRRGEKTPTRYARLDALARLGRARREGKTGANRPHRRLDGGTTDVRWPAHIS
jgi:hypothetical protein